MSEEWKIVLTASITVAGGVIVYVLGHFLEVLFIEPIHRLRSIIGEIADSLVYYAPVYGNPGLLAKEICDEASETLRRQASQLRARAYSIPWYTLWAFVGIIREKKEVEEASSELIGLSNSVHSSTGATASQNYRKQNKLSELLGIQKSKRKTQSQPGNRHIVADGILFFLFGMILLAVEESTLTLFGIEIFAFPNWFHTALGIVAIIISLAFMLAIFWARLAEILRNLLKESEPRNWRSNILYLYFVMFWLVYTVGWLKGLSSIPAEKFVFHLVFWFGFVWFFIIPIAWFKVILQRRK